MSKETELEKRLQENIKGKNNDQVAVDVKVGTNSSVSSAQRVGQLIIDNMGRGKEIIDKIEGNESSKADTLAQQVREALGKKYEMVNHPQHYNNYDKEVIDMMEDIWGTASTALFCQMNAFKYRMRMGTKPGTDINEDLKKEKWYLDKAKELKSKNRDCGEQKS